jgi:putative transposase
MARPLPIEFPGASYHQMARGNQGRAVFADDNDPWRFLKTLGQICENSVWVSERLQIGSPAKPTMQ